MRYNKDGKRDRNVLLQFFDIIFEFFSYLDIFVLEFANQNCYELYNPILQLVRLFQRRMAFLVNATVSL